MSMRNADDHVAQLEAAIAGQESLRSTLGNAIVDAAIAALRQQLDAARAQGRSRTQGLQRSMRSNTGNGADLESQALASLRSHLPNELAAKARAAGWTEGVRKQVTLLFADLSGFTALSEHASPEVIRAFQNDLFTELARLIYQYEGFVEKFVGDAVLAVFGAPVTHEDDPERALRVALAMRERMAGLNRRWSERLGAPVTLHVGINTGPVVAGKLGWELDGATATYAVTGDTVNTAARLQDAAQPGQVLVSRTTYRLAQAAFTFRALEPITVRGRSEPLAVYELLRARPLPGKLRGVQELGEVFVGREEPLSQLRVVTDELQRRGRVVVVTGEAGIGKSRLLAEWRKETREGELRWVEGRCFAHTATLSYGPFLDMLRRVAGIADDDSERRARQRLDAAVEHLFPGEVEARAVFASLLAMRLHREETQLLARLSAQELRGRIFVLVERLVHCMVAERPLVLLLEDMQWADGSSLELVQHLLDLTANEPLVVALVGRPDADSPLARLDLRLAMGDADRVLRLALEPLSETSSLSMVRDLLRAPDLPANLVTLVSDRAEGNPFFVEEIIRSLIELGALRHEDGAWVTTPLMDTISVPDTLQGLIMARIDRLPDETKDVVQQAAVIGRTFLYRVLLAIAQSSPSLDADLTHLERSELIRERTREPEVEYIFRHALTQEVAYQSLLSDRLREFHRRVAEAMERIFAGRLAEYYSIVAEHSSKGEDWEKAAEYELKEAERASFLYAEEARTHYERALDALARLPQTRATRRRRVDATIDLAREVHLGAGHVGHDRAQHLERLAAAMGLADSLAQGSSVSSREDIMRRGRLAAWLAYAYSLGGDSAAMSVHLQEALAVPGGIDDPQLAARIGQVQVHLGQFRRAADVLRPAVEPLERDGRWADWIHANGVLAMAEAAGGDYMAGLARAERGAARAENLRGPYWIEAAKNYLAITHLLGGDHSQSAGALKRNLEQASAGRIHPTGQHIVNVVTLWQAERDESRSAEEIQALVDRGWDTEQSAPLARWRDVFLNALKLRVGRGEEAQRELRRVLENARERSDLFAEGLALRYLAQALAAEKRGGDPAIDENMRLSRKQLEAGGCEVEAARTLVAWGNIALEQGHADEARDRFFAAARIFRDAGLESEIDAFRQHLEPD